MQEFQQKKRAEELAMGMVARNEALEELGFQVKEEENMSESAAREAAGHHAKFWAETSPPPFSSGYPMLSISHLARRL